MMRMASLLLALLAAAAQLGSACQFASWSIAKAADPPLNLSATAYTQEQVLAALQGWGATTGRYLDPVKSTFACVDSRQSDTQQEAHATLETAGGDISELMALITAYHRIKNVDATEDSVRILTFNFINRVATPKRPFYFHTADDKLQHAIAQFSNITGQAAVVLPNREPADTREQDVWYQVLTAAENQGCGHVRTTMQRPADYGLRTPSEISTLAWTIKAFYKYWWPTPANSAQRKKIYHPVLQGSLAARALALVDNVGPGCPGLEPNLAPFHGGSTMFLYHTNAVAAFRSRVLVPFITQLDPSVDGAALLSELNALQSVQLTATINYLPPLNQLPIWQANLTSTYMKK